MSASVWKRDLFLTVNNVHKRVAGFTYRGLGLRQTFRGSPKGRRPPMWSLYHLGTGHGLCHFSLPEDRAFAFATRLAECGDWDFDGLDGWMNRDPELKDRFVSILDGFRTENPKVWLVRGGGCQSPEAAQAIAMARA
jgi:hypothetical protein